MIQRIKFCGNFEQYFDAVGDPALKKRLALAIKPYTRLYVDLGDNTER